MSNTVSDVVARPVRTAAQGGLAWVVTENVDAFLYDMSDRQYGALLGLLIILFGWAQVLVENNLGKAFLRVIPEPDAPVVDNNDNPF